MIEERTYEPDYYSDSAKVQLDTKRTGELKTRLEELYYEWTKVGEELEKAG